MDELGFNKIFGALLAAVLVVLGLGTLSSTLFPKSSFDYHHGDDHGEKSLNEKLAERYAYYVEVAETGGGPLEEEIFDLGLALASADIARGERAFAGKCATCHSVNEGGPNGTGPNLYNIMGAQKHAVAGFGYSRAMEAQDGAWSYEAMNDWLLNPSAYVQGTSMAFAGLRRDDERVDTIAYLASLSPDAPAAPEPMAAPAEEAAVDLNEPTDAPVAVEEETAANETVDDSAAEAEVDAGGNAVEAATEADVAGAANDAASDVSDEGSSVAGEAADAADTATADAIEAAEDAVAETSENIDAEIDTPTED